MSWAADKKAPDFSLENWDGAKVSMQALKGKTVVLTFSYAYCSGLCPIITGRLFFLDAAINEPKDVVYLHVSIDPDADTPERRKNYFGLYGIDPVKDKRWMFVSGQGKQNRSELSRLWKFYGITKKKIIDKKLPEGYFIKYTAKTVVIDKNGFIRHETGFDFSEDELGSVIKKLSDKPDAPAIKFSKTRFECGTIKEGEIVKYDFEFINEGNAPLKIIDLVPA
jgi:protein SCO1/2